MDEFTNHSLCLYSFIEIFHKKGLFATNTQHFYDHEFRLKEI